MSPVLIISSHVAASRVGGGAQAAALAGLGVETILAPTVLFGRHPGLGAPGGGRVPQDMFEGVLSGVEATGAFETLCAVITGYFATPEQADCAVKTIDRIRAVNRQAWIVVDPIMGDSESGLYVGQAVASALARDLVPRADLIAPNAWELERLSGLAVAGPASAMAAAANLGRPTLVSSLDAGADIGVLYTDEGQAWLASHRRSARAPKGTGDLLTALFVAAVLEGAAAPAALETAVAAVAEVVGGEAMPVTLERLR
jgi:pyridoxine kinase